MGLATKSNNSKKILRLFWKKTIFSKLKLFYFLHHNFVDGLFELSILRGVLDQTRWKLKIQKCPPPLIA